MFSPDDLMLVKGSPGDRRRFLDDTLVALAIKYDALRLELDRIVRQRNTLLKQAGGRLTEEIEVTLDVWDAKFADARRPVRSCPGDPRGPPDPDGRARPTSSSPAPRCDRDALRASVAQDGLLDALREARIDRRATRRVARSDRTATNSRCRSTACRAARMPRRANNVRWRSRCVWPAIGWSPSARGRRRSWCSTTCSPNSTTIGRARCWPSARRARS